MLSLYADPEVDHSAFARIGLSCGGLFLTEIRGDSANGTPQGRLAEIALVSNCWYVETEFSELAFVRIERTVEVVLKASELVDNMGFRIKNE